MALGKKELTAAVVVGVVVIAAGVHFLVFQNKAQRYSQVQQEYQSAVETLGNAEFVRDEEAFTQYQNSTVEYASVMNEAVARLNLEALDFDTPPTPGNVDQWASATIALMSELNQRRAGQTQLTFLGPTGWNIPAQLPNNPGAAALQDRMSSLINAHRVLAASQQPNAEYTARQAYNAVLEGLGIPARETSYFVYPNYYQPQHFFNNVEWINNFLDSSGQRSGATRMPGGGYDLRNYHNVQGLQRFGIAVPALKKLWVYALVRQAVGEQANPAIMAQFASALEIGIPLESNEPLNSINKQLQAIIDIIDSAQRNGVRDIQYVAMMRPINLERATIRQPGATPPAEETADAGADQSMNVDAMGGMGMGMDMMMMDGMMGMGGGRGAVEPEITPVPDDQAVGTGAGLEIWMTADNSGMVRFFYDVSHRTATYGIDDLYVHQQQGNTLLTTATIEVITQVKTEGAAGMDAAPVEGEVY